MIGHIKQLCDSFISATQNSDSKHEGIHVFTWPKLIYEEIKDLRTTDFEPSSRYDFVLIKLKFSNLARMGSYDSTQLRSFAAASRNLRTILETYSHGSTEVRTKDFQFIEDPALKHIIQRDYKELDSILIPDGAWKSAVVLSGSILESILYDLLSQEEHRNRANSSEKAPRSRGNLTPITSGKWKLIALIEVAVDIGLLPVQRAASIDQVLRDYRNFVHPQKELRSQHPCTEAEAFMAKGCLDGIYNHLNNGS